MRATLVLTSSLSSLAFICGCGGAPPTVANETAAVSTPVVRESAPPPARAAQTPPATASAAEPPPCTEAFQSVYFDFDSDAIRDGAREQLQRCAQALQRSPGALQLTGGADPQGTEEYNLALGDRRGRAVSSYLRGLGVPPGKLRVHSVGEEWARGSDEQSWALDRRVDGRTAAGRRTRR